MPSYFQGSWCDSCLELDEASVPRLGCNALTENLPRSEQQVLVTPLNLAAIRKVQFSLM